MSASTSAHAEMKSGNHMTRRWSLKHKVETQRLASFLTIQGILPSTSMTFKRGEPMMSLVAYLEHFL